jgi:hypothetical protein
VSSSDLYPSGRPTLESHNTLLNRHARKIELCLIQDQANHDRLVDLDEKVDNLDARMSTQAQKLTDVQLAIAASDGSTKRLVAILGVVAVIAAPSCTALVNYITRPPQSPQYIPMTADERARWEQANPKR